MPSVMHTKVDSVNKFFLLGFWCVQYSFLIDYHCFTSFCALITFNFDYVH